MSSVCSFVDHESRTNSYRAEDEPRTTEATPLLERFPIQHGQGGSRLHTVVVVSLLLVILLSGMIIGIYLLVIQSRSESVLPPIETPEPVLSHFINTTDIKKNRLSIPKTSQVIAIQTDTGQCCANNCTGPLAKMLMDNSTISPYNFLISSDGQLFEALGWGIRSALFPEYDPSAVVLAFMGNYTEVAPASVQITKTQTFLADALTNQLLSPNYVILGKRRKWFPMQLFLELCSLPRWSGELSDSY